VAGREKWYAGVHRIRVDSVMFDDIDPRSPTPLYDQIAARVRLGVAAGDLRPGTTLPSVRQLAARLRVNPATVVQAYRALESEGFVEMRQGAGTYIQEVAGARRAKERDDQAAHFVREMISKAARVGIGTETLAAAFDRAVRTGAS